MWDCIENSDIFWTGYSYFCFGSKWNLISWSFWIFRLAISFMKPCIVSYVVYPWDFILLQPYPFNFCLNSQGWLSVIDTVTLNLQTRRFHISILATVQEGWLCQVWCRQLWTLSLPLLRALWRVCRFGLCMDFFWP